MPTRPGKAATTRKATPKPTATPRPKRPPATPDTDAIRIVRAGDDGVEVGGFAALTGTAGRRIAFVPIAPARLR